jgi:DNA-binding MarR family transcriptional regulator
MLYIQHMPADATKREAREIAGGCLASRARHLDRVLARIYDTALRGHGVTGAQLGMLVAIELAGPTTPAWLGRRLELERSTVSRNLARLQADGLVVTDGGVRVTARGAALIRACHPLWREAQQQARAALGEAQARLLEALDAPGLRPTKERRGS